MYHTKHIRKRNYTCTTQNTSGKDGTCYVCACPSSWATGSCPANSATCSTCKAISPYTVSKFNLVSCKAGYYKNGNSCTQCPAGSACDGINKTLCPAGSYSAAGASSCSVANVRQEHIVQREQVHVRIVSQELIQQKVHLDA